MHRGNGGFSLLILCVCVSPRLCFTQWIVVNALARSFRSPPTGRLQSVTCIIIIFMHASVLTAVRNTRHVFAVCCRPGQVTGVVCSISQNPAVSPRAFFPPICNCCIYHVPYSFSDSMEEQMGSSIMPASLVVLYSLLSLYP